MGRTVKPHMIEAGWPTVPSAAEAAPHRYTFESDRPDFDSFRAGQYDAMMAATTYKPGEVVFIERGGVAAKALILDVWVRRSDYDGHRREIFRVTFATARDTWSGLWEKTHPGFIQRGYVAAGLAPDCEGKM